jgi:hypothetical protein
MSGSTDSATIAKGKAYAQQVHALLGANAVGVWNFDEGTGSTVKDISGYGNDGTFVGDTHFVDSEIEGYALSFDGTGDYVNCGNVLNLGETTVTLWFKSDYTGRNGVIDFVTGTWGGFLFDFNGDGRPLLYLNTANYRYFDYSAGNYTADGNWHFLVVYIKGSAQSDISESTLSIDAIDIPVQGTASSGEALPWDILYIGRADSSYFNGTIDEVRIYRTSLSSTEIQKHYVQGLENLLANQVITQTEYDQRMKEFNQYLVRHEE